MNQNGSAYSGVGDILQEAADAGFSGAVTIEGAVPEGGVRGTVYLTEGLMYWAELGGPADPAAVAARLPLNQQAMARVRAKLGAGATLAVALAVSDGVAFNAVQRVIRSVAEAACRPLLALPDGQFHMAADARAVIGVIDSWPVAETVAAVRAAASEPADAGAELVELVPRPSDPVIHLNLTEWRVLAALSEPQAMRVLAERTGLPEREVAYAVSRLRQRELVLLPPGQPGPEAAPAPVAPEAAPAPGAAPVASEAPVAPEAAPVASAAATDDAVVEGELVLTAVAAAPPRPSTPAGMVTPVLDRRSNALRRLISAVRRI